MRKLCSLKKNTCTLNLDGIADKDQFCAVEGAILGNYTFSKYLSKKPEELKTMDIFSSSISKSVLTNIQYVCDGVYLARDLVNDNAAVVTPEHLAAKGREFGKKPGFKVTVLNERELKKQKLGLLSAVGQGSPNPPRLIIIEYKGDPKTKKTSAIVGKGITFDSGGKNLKPSGHIETMRCDMAGAAAVLGTMNVISKLKPRINVIGVCAAAHNAIDSTSYFPGDVIRAYNGTTVEICNTDAEGRLALADAVAYTVKKYKPAELIDLATLTGAILITFADRIAGIFSNNDNLANKLLEAGSRTGESLWRLPVEQQYCDAMKGDISDLRNISKLSRGHASSITAAAFIKEFIAKTPWAHIDIAGTAFNTGEARGDIPKYATGFGVRLLVDYLIG